MLGLHSLAKLFILYCANNRKVPVWDRFSFQSQLPFPRPPETVAPGASWELWFPVANQLHYVIALGEGSRKGGFIYSYIYIIWMQLRHADRKQFIIYVS